MRIPKSTASPKPRIDAIGGSAFKDVDVRYIGKIEIIDSYPKPPKSRIVDNLPEMIETIFGEALLTFDEMGKTGKRADQAIFAFRKTIERALLIKFPEMQGKSLYEMIDRLKSEGKITPELASWAHKIRTIGNASVHEIVDRETEIAEAKDMEVFTRMLLIYIFTLPQMLENRKVAN